MFTEILSCLALFTGDIDYGNPKTFAEITLTQDTQRNDVFYISAPQDQFRGVSSTPLNQDVQIYFTKPIQGFLQKIQYIESPAPPITRGSETKNTSLQVICKNTF